MKKCMFIILVMTSGLTSCVQKAYERKVRFILDASKENNIKSVAIRGSNNPLSWQSDLEMKPLFPDSIYFADVTFLTGYLGVEIKFVINGQFELQNEENRRIPFDMQSDSTIYKAVFNNK